MMRSTILSLALVAVLAACTLQVADARLSLQHKWSTPTNSKNKANQKDSRRLENNNNNNGYNYNNANNYNQQYSNQYNNANYNQNGYWDENGNYQQQQQQYNEEEEQVAEEEAAEEEQAAQADDVYYADDDVAMDAASDATTGYDDDGLHLEQYKKYLEVHDAMEAFRLATVILSLIIVGQGLWIWYLRCKVQSLLRSERSLLNSKARIEPSRNTNMI